MPPDCVPATAPHAAVFTVTVAGPERHDGEAGFTYVVYADDEHAARALVMEYHAASHDLRAVEICIDTGYGRAWRFGYDPAVRPDIVSVPAQSFPGPPDWPDDEPGRAWNDMRSPAEQARMLTTLAAEHQRHQVARDFGLDVADIDTGRSEAPTITARDAILHVMQLRARRAFSPGRPLTEGAAITAFILGSTHIRALTTAICDRDLANGVEPDDVGQVLVDANYHAYNLGAGTDEEAPPYFHRRLDVDLWPLLKAGDCYLFQIQNAGNEAAAAAHNAIARLRTELIADLDADEDYRMRWEWDSADGWPLLEAVPAAVRRAEALIGRYQDFDDIEELSSPDWGQHISDMIADLLRYAHDDEAMDPHLLLDTGLTHFHAETHRRELELETAKPSVLRLLVATESGQGQRAYDFCHTLPGEILFPPAECPHCHDPADERRCHLLYGADTGRATTTFAVAEVPISVPELHRLLAKAWGLAEVDIDASDIADAAAQMMSVASHFPVGAVLGRTARRYRRRHLSAPENPATPPSSTRSTRSATSPGPEPDAPDAAGDEPQDDELKSWTVSIRATVEYHVPVEAVDEDEAEDFAWSVFDDGHVTHRESEVQVSLAA